MITGLSILIPTFNRRCLALAEALRKQAEDMEGTAYEIIVADDCSTDEGVRRTNAGVARLPHGRLVELPRNVGRSRIRNLLAREAAYGFLLYLDADVEVARPDFLRAYSRCEGDAVVYGGIALPTDAELAEHNLRYRYETACLPKFTATERQRNPYRGFRTTNFLIRREVMLAHPFDERIVRYGYEDVLFGKSLQKGGIPIRHIDNPVRVDDFEPNGIYLRKTEEALQTLLDWEDEMAGYSNIISAADKLHHSWAGWLAGRLFDLAEPLLRRNLTGNHPSVKLYQTYRLGHYLNLKKHKEKNR